MAVAALVAITATSGPLAAQSQRSPDQFKPESWYGTHVSVPGQTAGGWGVGSATLTSTIPDGTASATVDAETGTIRASAYSAQTPPRLTGSWQVSAKAGFWGAAYIGAEDLEDDDDRMVRWKLQITGTAKQGRFGGDSRVEAAYYFGTDSARFAGAGSGSVTLQKADTLLIEGGFALPTFQPLGYTRMFAYAGLGVLAHNSAFADYGNTVRFTWSVPAGATVWMPPGRAFIAPTVRSATTVTPEPASLALTGAGVAALGAAARRRRAAAAR